MKRLLLVALCATVSMSISMGQPNLQDRLDDLVVQLNALGQALQAPVVAVPPVVPPVVVAPVPPVVSVPPVPPVPGGKPPKVKDPIKQAVAQFLAGLSSEQRAAFENLTPEERTTRLGQILTGSVKQQEPVEPVQIGGEQIVVEKPPFEIPAAPGGPGIPMPPAPPAPPAPGIKLPGKPVIAKPAKVLLPILSADELAAKSMEEKNRSDALFLQQFIELSQREFTKLSDMEAAFKSGFEALRNDEQFLKRAELDAFLKTNTGFLGTMNQEFSVDLGAKTARLLELYETFSQVKTSMLYQALIPLVSSCLFDAQKLNAQELELLSVSYVVAQRGVQPAKGEVGREAREKSDRVFIAAWQTLTDAQNGMNNVVRAINFVCMHPDFLLYQNMLWAGAEGSIERRLQSQDPLKGTLPLLLVLKMPQQFKLTFPVVSTTIKSHFFSIDEYEKNINNDLVKAAYEWQVKNSKTVELISLKDYVLGRLKTIKSLSQLRALFTQAEAKYPEQTKELHNELALAVAQLEVTNPKIDLSVLSSALHGLIGQDIPQDAKKIIENLIVTATKDRALVATVIDALKVKGDFGAQLVAQLEAQGNDIVAQQLKESLTNLYRTPRDIYDILVAHLADKTALADYQTSIIQRIKPYGILLGAFKYYADQYKRNPELIEQLKSNLGMIMKSINVIAHPQAQLGTGKSAAEEIAAKLPGIRAQLSSGKELVNLPYAPQLFDIAINNALVGKERSGYYTSQLTKYDFYKGLGLDGLLNLIKQDKNPQRVVEFLTQLVRNAQGVSIDSPAFIELMNDIQVALQGTYDKGIKPEYIE